ncbi:MAG: hypothetical protein ACSLE6_05235 [Mycobacterium sp.]
MIRTEPVLMTDGTVHGVQMWNRPARDRTARTADPGSPGVESDHRHSYRRPGGVGQQGDEPRRRAVQGPQLRRGPTQTRPEPQ